MASAVTLMTLASDSAQTQTQTDRPVWTDRWMLGRESDNGGVDRAGPVLTFGWTLPLSRSE